MPKYIRARQVIIDYLKENGEATTTELYDHLNATSRYGITKNALGNILGKHPEIHMISPRSFEPGYNSRHPSIWRLK